MRVCSDGIEEISVYSLSNVRASCELGKTSWIPCCTSDDCDAISECSQVSGNIHVVTRSCSLVYVVWDHGIGELVVETRKHFAVCKPLI